MTKLCSMPPAIMASRQNFERQKAGRRTTRGDLSHNNPPINPLWMRQWQATGV